MAGHHQPCSLVRAASSTQNQHVANSTSPHPCNTPPLPPLQLPVKHCPRVRPVQVDFPRSCRESYRDGDILFCWGPAVQVCALVVLDFGSGSGCRRLSMPAPRPGIGIVYRLAHFCRGPRGVCTPGDVRLQEICCAPKCGYILTFLGHFFVVKRPEFVLGFLGISPRIAYPPSGSIASKATCMRYQAQSVCHCLVSV
jgi:hypothetical protein